MDTGVRHSSAVMVSLMLLLIDIPLLMHPKVIFYLLATASHRKIRSSWLPPMTPINDFRGSLQREDVAAMLLRLFVTGLAKALENMLVQWGSIIWPYMPHSIPLAWGNLLPAHLHHSWVFWPLG